MEIESARRGESRIVFFKKMERKYLEYHNKHRKICRRFGASGNFLAIRDELKKKDDELMKVINKYSKLDGALWDKEGELEVRNGVEAECTDLHTLVVSWRAELDQCTIRAESLSDEVIEKMT